MLKNMKNENGTHSLPPGIGLENYSNIYDNSHKVNIDNLKLNLKCGITHNSKSRFCHNDSKSSLPALKESKNPFSKFYNKYLKNEEYLLNHSTNNFNAKNVKITSRYSYNFNNFSMGASNVHDVLSLSQEKYLLSSKSTSISSIVSDESPIKFIPCQQCHCILEINIDISIHGIVDKKTAEFVSTNHVEKTEENNFNHKRQNSRTSSSGYYSNTEYQNTFYERSNVMPDPSKNICLENSSKKCVNKLRLSCDIQSTESPLPPITSNDTPPQSSLSPRQKCFLTNTSPLTPPRSCLINEFSNTEISHIFETTKNAKGHTMKNSNSNNNNRRNSDSCLYGISSTTLSFPLTPTPDFSSYEFLQRAKCEKGIGDENPDSKNSFEMANQGVDRVRRGRLTPPQNEHSRKSSEPSPNLHLSSPYFPPPNKLQQQFPLATTLSNESVSLVNCFNPITIAPNLARGGDDHKQCMTCPCLCHDLLKFGLLANFPGYLSPPQITHAATSNETALPPSSQQQQHILPNLNVPRSSSSIKECGPPKKEMELMSTGTEFKKKWVRQLFHKQLNLNEGHDKMEEFHEIPLVNNNNNNNNHNDSNNSSFNNNNDDEKCNKSNLFLQMTSTNQQRLFKDTIGLPLLIMEKRPNFLPPKNLNEEVKHNMLYNKMIEATKRKEAQQLKKCLREFKEKLKYEDRLTQILQIWNTEILPNWEIMKNTKKTYYLWGLGLPPSVRGKIWYLALTENQNFDENEDRSLVLSSVIDMVYLADEEKALKMPNDGDTLVQDSPSLIKKPSTAITTAKTMDCPLKNIYSYTLSHIKLDVSRTFPQLCIFQEGGPYHGPLKRLLMAYSIYDPNIGYVQGMSFIGAILLLNMELEQAFLCFCNIMELPCFQTFYALDQFNMNRYFDLYSEFLESNLPYLSEHFLSMNFTPDLYLIDWIYTIYSRSLPLDLTCKIWDLFLRDGETFLFKTALGILKMNEDILLNMDFMQSAQFLTKLSEHILPEELFNAISKIVI